MTLKEQIAHELTMIYMNNRYGIDVTGAFSLYDGRGDGDIKTVHLPHTSEGVYGKVEIGETSLFGKAKTEKGRVGDKVDELFSEMVTTYYTVYAKFLKLLNEHGEDAEQ